MDHFNIKFRLIFIPFLIISAVTIIAYSFLRWLLFIKNSIAIVDEDVLDFWAPCFFVLIPIYIWLGPRIKILDLTSRGFRSDPFAGLLILAAIAVAAPTIMAQIYLSTATGKLTILENIGQINNKPTTKYYKVKNFYVDKSLMRYFVKFKVSGKNNTDFDMTIYAVVPVYAENHTVKSYNFRISAPKSPINSDNALIVLNGKPVSNKNLGNINPRSIKNITILKGVAAAALYGERGKRGAILIRTTLSQMPDTLQVIHDDNVHYPAYVWLGVKYFKSINNHLSLIDKNAEYKKFAKESQNELSQMRLDNFEYLDRISYSTDLDGYMAAIKSVRDSTSLAAANVLTPVNEAFEARNGNSLPWTFGAFVIGSVVFILMLLLKSLRSDLEYKKAL